MEYSKEGGSLDIKCIDKIPLEESMSITEELLNDKGLLTEAVNWTADQWIEFYSKDGVMSLEEFKIFNKEIIDKIFPQE